MAHQVKWEGARRRAGPCRDWEAEGGRAAGLRAGQAVEAIAEVYTDSPGGLDTGEYPRVGTGAHGGDGRPSRVRPEDLRKPGGSWKAMRGAVGTCEVCKEPGLGGSVAPSAQALGASTSQAEPSPPWPLPAPSGPVTFLAKGRREAKEATGGQGRRRRRRRRDPTLARFLPGFGPGFCRMRGCYPHCHRALHVATRRRKMADLRPCRHNNGPRQG